MYPQARFVAKRERVKLDVCNLLFYFPGPAAVAQVQPDTGKMVFIGGPGKGCIQSHRLVCCDAVNCLGDLQE